MKSEMDSYVPLSCHWMEITTCPFRHQTSNDSESSHCLKCSPLKTDLIRLKHHIQPVVFPDLLRLAHTKQRHSCCQRSLTPIQAHALPSACRAESCLLCCQPEPSLSRYLPDYHELLHDSLADCKLKGDELST